MRFEAEKFSYLEIVLRKKRISKAKNIERLLIILSLDEF